MPWLSELFGKEDLPRVWVEGLCWDSRKVQPGDLFFALRGTKVDGHRFIPEAVQKGAVAVVGEERLSELPVPYLQVENARRTMAEIACAFYGHPTKKLCSIGVTGTNGKTTVVHLLGQLLPDCEALTTVRVEEEGLSCVTTPEAPDLQRLAAHALAQGKKFFAFEASSIGLAQHRLDGSQLSAAVFTNFSRDHLDFHGSMEAYLSAKLRLFDFLVEGGLAVVNVRLPARVFAAAKKGRLLTFGLGRGEVRGKEIESTPSGMGFVVESRFGKEKAFLPFFGVHNVENALAALAVGLGLGFSLRELLEKLSQASQPPGRFARWETARGATVVVDFAHNPEALRAMLLALRPRARKLIAVFGCPGEADRGKRRIMGEIAGRLADLVVITSDNPKSEDPKAIAAEIARGAAEVGGTWTVILDRAEAIAWAVEEAQAGDCVLIAGKGHERYQIFAHRREPFSDLGLVHALVASSPK